MLCAHYVWRGREEDNQVRNSAYDAGEIGCHSVNVLINICDFHAGKFSKVTLATLRFVL